MGRAAGKSSTKDSKGLAAVLARRSVEASEPLPAIDAEGRFTGAGARGLTFERRWTTPGVHPYDEVAWEQRTASISSESGKSVFEQPIRLPPVSSTYGQICPEYIEALQT